MPHGSRSRRYGNIECFVIIFARHKAARLSTMNEVLSQYASAPARVDNEALAEVAPGGAFSLPGTDVRAC